MKNNSFCAFILSHGRAKKVKTYNALRRSGYTGDIALVVDDEDEQIETYQQLYGEDNVYIFNKDDVARHFDVMNTWNIRNVIVYARNYCYMLARKIGVKNFVELDDDYESFLSKFTKSYKYNEQRVTNLDEIFDAYIDYLNQTNISIIAMLQNGDFVGGSNSGVAQCIYAKRKTMNVLFCKTEQPLLFNGAINEDVNMYIGEGNKGKLLLSPNIFTIKQVETQSSDGGMTTCYRQYGTYVKSFFSVMVAPSCVMVAPMNSKNPRIHHRIKYRIAIPMIIREDFKKQ